MPIYEFKCLTCEACMEVLVMGGDDNQTPLKCSQCGGGDLERIISTTNFAMGSSSGNSSSAPSTEKRTCSSGSCTTWNLPGH